MYGEVVCGLLKIPCEHFCGTVSSDMVRGGQSRTVTPHLKVYHISNANVDDTKKALILLLELLLIEDLYS